MLTGTVATAKSVAKREATFLCSCRAFHPTSPSTQDAADGLPDNSRLTVAWPAEGARVLSLIHPSQRKIPLVSAYIFVLYRTCVSSPLSAGQCARAVRVVAASKSPGVTRLICSFRKRLLSGAISAVQPCLSERQSTP